MCTHFITAEIELAPAQQDLVETIQQAIADQGVPLRWAITAVDQENQTAHIEAVVTKQS